MTEGRLTKEELREDPVLEALAKLKRFFQEQGTVVTIVMAIVAVGVIGFSIARRVRARAEQQTAVLLLEGEGQYSAGNVGDALKKFQDAYAAHKSTPSGRIALLRSADCQLEIGNLEDAKRLYQEYLATHPKDGLLKSSGLRGLAATLDSMGQHEEAARWYMQAADIAASPLRPDDLISAGNAFLDAGKTAEAKTAFQRVVENFPESARVRDAREGLETAAARSGS